MNIQQKIQLLKDVSFEMFPDAVTDLVYENDFQLLIAILMSAQTTDRQVNKANARFFTVLKTPQDGIDLGAKKIESYINSIGFYRNKAKNIFLTCEALIQKYNGNIPTTIDELVTLPWVWIKTAKVYLAITQDAPYLWVDTHVHRVLNRLGIVKTNTPEKTDKEAEKIFSKDDLALLHHTLIFFGRYHCTAKKPQCGNCDLQHICTYENKKSS